MRACQLEYQLFSAIHGKLVLTSRLFRSSRYMSARVRPMQRWPASTHDNGLVGQCLAARQTVTFELVIHRLSSVIQEIEISKKGGGRRQSPHRVIRVALRARGRELAF